MRWPVYAASAAIVTAAIATAQPGTALASGPTPLGRSQHAATRTPIKHFLFLMQGGRTFDNYFGTYPGADGIPANACERLFMSLPKDGCIKPFPARGMQQPSLGADPTVVKEQYDHGRMDGFVAAYARQGRDGTAAMSYYDARQLPFYWTLAHDYVLFDHFFSASLSGTRANRTNWVAGPRPRAGAEQSGRERGGRLTIFDRLQAADISWKFYVQDYRPNQNYLTPPAATLSNQTARVPLLDYPRFVKNKQLRAHIVSLSQYYRDLRSGTLPAVAFVASSPASNERSARTLTAGQRLVRTLITQLMLSRYWNSSAFLWSYDGSGGYYDHVVPPRAGSAPLGLRVPALLVSAYARRGQVNHSVLDYASALAFIENNWHLSALNHSSATSGSLQSAFNFAAGPRPPVIIAATRSQGGITLPLVPKPPAGAVYFFYGGALALALLILALALISSARSVRRPSGTGQ